MDAPLLDLAKQFGPLIGVILFFIWRDWKREDSLSQRIVALEEQQQSILMATIEKTTAVIERNTAVMEQNARVMEQNANTMSRLHSAVERLTEACPSVLSEYGKPRE